MKRLIQYIKKTLIIISLILMVNCSNDDNGNSTVVSDLYLTNILYTNVEFSYSELYSFEYDTDYNLTKLLTPEPEFYSFVYQYQDNLILREDEEGSAPTYGYCDYAYNNNVLDKIVYTRGYANQAIDEFDFGDDQTFYTRNYTFIESETYTTNYSNNATYDDDNNLILLETINETNGGNIEIYSFEYNNENLVKIVDNENVVWEFIYDNKKNFKTFFSHFNGGYFYFGPPADKYIDYSIISNKLRNIPFFYNFNNKNNPTRILKNGVLYKEITYDYNEQNYPIKMTFNNGNYYTLSY